MTDITKQCAECSKSFVVLERDQEYYNNLDVPIPTLCPACRFQRRLSFRNERNLYARTCHLCNANILSIYSEEKPYIIYCRECWWSDQWSPLEYGQDIDWDRPFFEQYQEVRLNTPRIALINDSDSENSEYTNQVYRLKNCYMVFDACDNENSVYSTGIYDCKDNIDCAYNDRAELCYETFYSEQCYDLKYSRDCVNCRNSSFLIDCVGVSNSFMCVGLRNQEYHFKNQKLSPEEYQAKVAEYKLHTGTGVARAQKDFKEFALTVPRKYFHGIRNEDSDGDYLLNNKNVHHSFQTRSSENCSYTYGVHKSKDSYDYTIWGEDAIEMYESQACGGQSYRHWFCNTVWNGQENYYCDNCLQGAEFCFGCAALKKEKYCILNKQYSKEEYFVLRDKLIDHMKKTKEWGEFMPQEMSPFGYNETMANEFYPLDKQTALAQNRRWQDTMPGTYGKETLQLIPDDIHDTEVSITKEVLACTNCRKNYKIVDRELEFLKKQLIPVPDKCPDCRHLERTKLRNPYALTDRQCMCELKEHVHQDRCPAQFKTAYPEHAPELIYCEECYKQETY